MTDVKRLIESGILEVYVLGNATAAEAAMVEEMMAQHSEVKDEIDAISITLEQYDRGNAIQPPADLRVFLMATINYMERMKAGEQPSFPPPLHAGSQVKDYAPWLSREDLQLTEEVEDAFAHIIGYTPEATTAIAWLRYGALPETHTAELEKFLVLEGSCDITVGDEVHSLKAGDVLMIPLYVSHHVQVTSTCLCKIILQRAAA
jgi:mannose-6-phosphate isomerase-like protein (cupin superfamily)